MKVFKVRDDLFIRGQFDRRSDKLQELFDLKVGAVVSMLRKTDHDLENLDWLNYYKFPLPDTNTVKESAIWHAAFNAAREIQEGKNVLIHCISAADRSPAVAALTLTILEGISGSEAMMRVRSVKPNTLKNKAFVAYLNAVKAADYAV